MKSVVICGREARGHKQYTTLQTIKLEETLVTVGFIETEKPDFNPHAFENRFQVLIKVRAFSCNHSDKAHIFAVSQKCGDGACYAYVGSEFVGEVIAIGLGVRNFQVGDRVMGNNQFPDADSSELLAGLPTMGASKRYSAIHEARLVKVPVTMSDAVAAAFSVGAQTSYSMIRKLHLQAGKNVLLTAITSSTSLFVVNVLKRYTTKIYATTTKDNAYTRKKLMQMGVEEVIPIANTSLSLRENRRIEEIVLQTGGFNYVIDPFFELYLNKVVYAMAMEGKYITCGKGDLYPQIAKKTSFAESVPLQYLMLYVSFHNIQLIGNFLGQKEDLEHAIEDYKAGLLDVTIDSVLRENQIAGFFERTYNAQDRLGKVVYCYDD